MHDPSVRERGKQLKELVSAADQAVSVAEQALDQEGLRLPVLTHSASPVGPESEAITLRTIGTKPSFDFEVRNHLEIGSLLLCNAVAPGTDLRASACRRAA